jgi:uncharacterized membrane protein HdeD (DUF308 family)
MQEVLLGAVAMGSAVAAVFFLRFWRQTRERLFLIFALAFLVDAVMRVVLAVTEVPNEQEPFFYLGRLLTFILIAVAIIDKNRGSGASRK